MNTKIVYAVIDSESSTYLEQTLCSAFSAKYHNPTVRIILVIDHYTDIILNKKCSHIQDYIDEKIVVPISDEFTKKQKSRWLKTSLRNIIDGDFIFIDSDTIITSTLAEIDNFELELGAVKDLHLNLKDHIHRKSIAKKGIILGNDIFLDENYYNSGVLYVKDTHLTRNFYKSWHKNWLESIKLKIDTDQPSLSKTNIESGHLIKEISGIYNCQIRIGIAFFYDAKIIHFFNTWDKTDMSPFFGDSFYIQVKDEKCLKDELKNKIINCKREFILPIMLIDKYEFEYKRTRLYNLLYRVYRDIHPLYFLLNGFLAVIEKTLEYFSIKKK